MKAIALCNRLSRDLDVGGIDDLSANDRLAILDAINGSLQTMHDLAPHESKTTVASLAVGTPKHISIGVTNGSTEVTVYQFVDDDIYCSIQIQGDSIYNQVRGATSMLHPFIGTSGTVPAIIYGDAMSLPEPYAELVGDPEILETGQILTKHFRENQYRQTRNVGMPRTYWVEANARNQNPFAPSVIRFDPLPDKAYRMQASATFAPLRVAFADLVAPGPELPIRAEHVESYLIPIARAALTHLKIWKDKDDIAPTRAEAKEAKDNYAILVPKTISTPSRRVRTKRGF
jgi:hypothetical protein